MASVLMKRCTSCKEYTLQETCPRCGAKAKPNRPAKFSPEDQYGEYRRKLKKLDAAKGVGNSDSERKAGAQPADAPSKPRTPTVPPVTHAEKRPGFTGSHPKPTDPPTAPNAPKQAPVRSAPSAGSADGPRAKSKGA